MATANHKEIMAALRKHDLRAACVALRNNLRTGREPILAWLKARSSP
jgi:DNA-binding GntR family transcriptional regulator